MFPPLWGHIFWDNILIIAINYPIKPTEYQQKKFQEFIESVIFLLPCGSCAVSGVVYLQQHPPINIGSRKEAIQYVVDFHNHVNVKLGKATMTPKQAVEAFDMRMKKNFVDLPRAMQIRNEDSERIKTLEQKLVSFEGGSTSLISQPSSPDNILIYVIVGLSILIVLLIIILLVLGRNHILLRRRKN